MVIGNGLIAKKFSLYKNHSEFLIFASGVSNSQSIKQVDFDREEKLLRDCLHKYSMKTFIYFSSCDLQCEHTKEHMYYQHKQKMEKIIQENAESYHIFRLPQVVGRGGNRNTLMNFLVYNIFENTEFNLYIGTYKNIIDIDDVFKICSYILNTKLYQNKIINITNKYYFDIERIVTDIEIFLKKKAKFNKVMKKNFCRYINVVSDEIIQNANVSFSDQYIISILNKYYKKLLYK